MNLGLKPGRSGKYEVGVKAGNEFMRANLAAFYIKTSDELAVLQNSSGRTGDQNIGETTRRGLELGLDAKWGGGFTARFAFTDIKGHVPQPVFSCRPAPRNPLQTLGVTPPHHL